MKLQNTWIKRWLFFREAVDRAADEKEWAEDVEDELAELREEAEAHYQRRLEEYRTNLEAWKKQKQLKVSTDFNTTQT